MSWHWCCVLLVLISPFLHVTSQPVPTPANIVCYQEVVATQGTYDQINSALTAWSQKLSTTLGLTGPIEHQVGWARVPDRTSFENGCNGPYPNIADLFVHIQTTSSQYDTIASQLETFIANNRMTSQPNIVCSARSVVTFIPGCGKTGGAAPINNSTSAPTNATTTSAPTNATTTSRPTNATTTTSPPTNATTTPPTTHAPTNVTNTTTAPPTTSAPTTKAPTKPPSTVNVTVNNNFFSPSNITIHVGDTVEWTWNGGPHTVTSGTPGNPDGKFCSLSGNKTQDLQSCSGAAYATSSPYKYSHTFTTTGTFPYFCAIHQAAMTGVVNVVAQSTIVAGALDQTASGSMSYNGAQSVTTTRTWMVIPLIMAIITIF